MILLAGREVRMLKLKMMLTVLLVSLLHFWSFWKNLENQKIHQIIEVSHQSVLISAWMPGGTMSHFAQMTLPTEENNPSTSTKKEIN